MKSELTNRIRHLLKQYHIWFFLLILLVGLSVRIVSFGSIPSGANQDEVMAGIEAKALASYHTDRFGTFMPVMFLAWGEMQMAVLTSYLAAPIVSVLGLSIITLRLPSLICSIIGLIIVYLFAREIIGKNKALLIFAFACICPWHIMQSRWGLEANLLPHFLMLGVFFLLRAINHHKINYCISMLFFGLSMYSYGISIYVVPIMLCLFAAYLFISKRTSITWIIISLCVYLLIAWPYITCMIINTFHMKTISLPFCTIPLFSSSTRGKDILFFSQDPIRQLLHNGKQILYLIIQKSDGKIYNQLPKYGTMYLVSIPFILLGLYTSIAEIKKNLGYAFILIFFITGLINGLITNDVNVNRANTVYYPLIFLIGLGMIKCWSWMKDAFYFIPALYLVCFSLFCGTYFTTGNRLIGDAFLADFGSAIQYANTLEAHKYYITPHSLNKGSKKTSEILTLFYTGSDLNAYMTGEFSEKYNFQDPSEADVIITRDCSDNAVEFGRFYVINQR